MAAAEEPNRWKTMFDTPLNSYSDVFMPLITLGLLKVLNEEDDLDKNLSNQRDAIIASIFAGNKTKYAQILTAIITYLYANPKKTEALNEQYTFPGGQSRPYKYDDSNKLQDFGHIPGYQYFAGDLQDSFLREIKIPEEIDDKDELDNIYDYLEFLINRHLIKMTCPGPDTGRKKYLKYKNKYLLLKNKLNIN